MAFDTLLIANRGEIACRIIRTARAAGLRTVAVYSDADRDARHVKLADAAIGIGPARASESYLSIERLIAASLKSGAQAIHPGYGFLAERAAFARACREAGLIFVGPSPEAIETLGSKTAAKSLAQSLGIPCLPGYQGSLQDDEHLLTAARELGFPLMIKAAAGGGGRGMRRVEHAADFLDLLKAARAEAESAFGRGELLLERLLSEARHIEVQVMGDHQGKVLHLGERDCSSQRRHQKILEEAPAPGLPEHVREALGDCAVRLARAVHYVGAGTVEFLLDQHEQFYFLEMNTRLQVEHPVTEAVTGLDLVDLQLRVAQGDPLDLEQSDVRIQGHAIEARLCAEDPWEDFAPQAGMISRWRMPSRPGLRIDHGLAEHASVTAHYDSLIAKLVASAADRDTARRRLITGLSDSTVLGVGTNRDLLRLALSDEAFAAARVTTHWLGARLQQWERPQADTRWFCAAAALWLAHHAAVHGDLAHWRSSGVHAQSFTLRAGQCQVAASVQITPGTGQVMRVTCNDALHEVLIEGGDILVIDHERLKASWQIDAAGGWLDLMGFCSAFTEGSREPAGSARDDSDGSIIARMHARVAQVQVGAGSVVAAGERLLSLEAMKMEHHMVSPIAGVIEKVLVQTASQVSPGQLLMTIQANQAPAASSRGPSSA
jgi:geranyl-CoA carboxylase alpha subunit